MAVATIILERSTRIFYTAFSNVQALSDLYLIDENV